MKVKVKVMLCTLLSLMLVLTVIGCAPATEEPAAEEPVAEEPAAEEPVAEEPVAEEPAEGFTMGVIVKVQVPWFDRLNEGLQKYGNETGNEIFMLAPTSTDAAQQVQMIEDLIAQQVDVIGIIPNSAEALESVLQKARDQGIKVVSHEAPDIKNVDVGVEAFKDEDFGEFLMEALAEKMNYEGEYATIIESLTNYNHNTWLDSGVAYQKENYPDMKLVSEKSETRADVSTAQSVVEELLKTYPDLKGVMGTGSADVPGAALAVENRGLSGEVAIVGCTSPNDAAEYLNRGTVTMIGLWDPAQTGYAMCILAEMAMNEELDQLKEGMDLGIEGFDNITLRDGKYVIGSAMLGIHAGDDVTKYPF